MPEKDIFEILKRDHGQILELLSRVDTPLERDERARRYDEVRAEIKAHAAAEEAVFYPRLRQSPQAVSLAREGLHDHAEMDKLMYELDSLDVYDEEWLEATRDLRDCFRHHAKDEEGRYFAKLRLILDERSLSLLGEEFERIREGSLRAA